jgi:hypothetical protein
MRFEARGKLRPGRSSTPLHTTTEKGRHMRYGDAFDRLGELRATTQQLVKEFTLTESPEPGALLKKILIAFELRWKLEELVLMPALQDTQGAMLCGTRDAARELVALRDLAALLHEPGSGLQRQRTLLCAIDALAALRTQRLSLALTRAERSAVVDTRALGVEMDRLLERLPDAVRTSRDACSSGRVAA